MLEAPYNEVRFLMRPGDVVLFGGLGWLSSLIQWWTKSPVSHAGMISFAEDHNGRQRVRVTDSTSLDGRVGVVTRYMSDVVQDYAGRVWWLPLSAEARARIDLDAFGSYLTMQEGARYDFWQVARAGFKALVGWNITAIEEDSRRVFCSEYVAQALEESGAYQWPCTSSVTPAELAAASIYAREYWQIKGGRAEIFGYNGSNLRGIAA